MCKCKSTLRCPLWRGQRAFRPGERERNLPPRMAATPSRWSALSRKGVTQ